MVNQQTVDDAIVAFHSHSNESFSSILKAMFDAVKRSDSPGAALRTAFMTILSVTYGEDDEKPDEKVLGEMVLLSADGVIEDVVDAILSNSNKNTVKKWLGGVVRALFSKFCITSGK